MKQENRLLSQYIWFSKDLQQRIVSATVQYLSRKDAERMAKEL